MNYRDKSILIVALGLLFVSCNDNDISSDQFTASETRQPLVEEPTPEQGLAEPESSAIDNEPKSPNCIEGTKLGIWIDPDESGDIKQNNYKGEIIAYQAGSQGQDAKDNYNYFSSSAHPIIGPQPSNYTSKIFFYEDSKGLNFNFYHNKDEDGSADWVDVKWDIETSGNGNQDDVILSDDNAELTKQSSSNGKQQYKARWSYKKNTDGGIIGPFTGQDFTIHVKVLDSEEINGAGFFSADGKSFDLIDPSDSNAVLHSFIIGFKSEHKCD